LVVLTLGAVVALAIGLAGIPQGYVVFGALSSVMLLGVVWPWVAMLGLKSELRFERRRAREGERVVTVLSVHNRMPWPVWGLVLENGFLPEGAQFGPSSGEPGDAAVALARVAGWSRSDFPWTFEPACRGEYPLQPPRLTTAFPFGLWKRSQPAVVQSRLLVWPRIASLGALTLDQGPSWNLSALSDRRSGHEGDILGTRSYRTGDALRHVHWSQTARQGQLVVCERQASQSSSIRVVLDSTCAHHAGDGACSSLEWSIRVMASVCHALLNHDVRLTITLGEPSFAVEPTATSQQRLNDALARLEPTARFSPSSRKPSAARTNGELEIVVTTDRGAAHWAADNARRRLIVFDTRSAADRDDCRRTARFTEAWIVLDCCGDVLGDLRQQWEEGVNRDH
jgi:uncharacterized protein (DUF58 family)